jgi:hypothetical protein
MDCGFIGTDAWLAQSEWGKQNNISTLGREPLYFFNGTEQVAMHRYRYPVEQVVLSHSGHLVPFDIPAVAREMMFLYVSGHHDLSTIDEFQHFNFEFPTELAKNVVHN